MKLFPKIDFSKLKQGLFKTRASIVNKITETLTRKATIDADTLDELESVLLSSDLGYDLTEKIISNVRSKILSENNRSVDSIMSAIKHELISILPEGNKDFLNTIQESKKPYVIILVGINGAGKTTTVGKLANNFKELGYSVIIGSADTFRAAANDQLKIWAERANVELIDNLSSDPASVVYDTIQKAITYNIDIVIIDTAGRLHNNKNLMNELNKIQNVSKALIANSKIETFLVLDGNSGQNAINQVNEFSKYVDITGLIITKLDGTAKGGAIFQICYNKKWPIRFIGVGEGLEDLQFFDPIKFVEAIIP
jgi:fused signal recognition particle receptor